MGRGGKGGTDRGGGEGGVKLRGGVGLRRWEGETIRYITEGSWEAELPDKMSSSVSLV